MYYYCLYYFFCWFTWWIRIKWWGIRLGGREGGVGTNYRFDSLTNTIEETGHWIDARIWTVLINHTVVALCSALQLVCLITIHSLRIHWAKANTYRHKFTAPSRPHYGTGPPDSLVSGGRSDLSRLFGQRHIDVTSLQYSLWRTRGGSTWVARADQTTYDETIIDHKQTVSLISIDTFLWISSLSASVSGAITRSSTQ